METDGLFESQSFDEAMTRCQMTSTCSQSCRTTQGVPFRPGSFGCAIDMWCLYVFVVWGLRLFFIPKVNEWMFWQSELINKLGDRCIMRHSAADVKSLCHFKLPVDLQKVLRAKPPKFMSDRLLINPVDSLFSRVGASPIWLVKTKHIEKIEHWRQVRWQEIVHSNLSAHFILQPLVCLSFAAKALPWPAWPAWLTASESAKGHLANRMLESSGVCINQ